MLQGGGSGMLPPCKVVVRRAPRAREYEGFTVEAAEDQPFALIMHDVTFEKIVLTAGPTHEGRNAPAAIVMLPASSAYSIRSCPRLSVNNRRIDQYSFAMLVTS
jgi:hypothetical protein